MRIGVVSDSHGNADMLRRALKQMGAIDLLIHAGDHYRDAISIGREAGITTAAVVGNCDWGAPGPEELELELAGQKILIVHGHRFGVKAGNDQLIQKLKDGQYDLIIYGHSHVPELTRLPQGYLLNPGSLASPRRNSKPSFALVEIGEKGLAANIMEIK